jgi:hypothetical protein
MSLHSFIRGFANAFRGSRPLPKRSGSRPKRSRLGLEQLEDRCTPVTSVSPLSGGLTPADLVTQLVGGGLQVSNIQYTGGQTSAGTFSGGTSSIGFDAGVILTSGNAAAIVGNGNGNFSNSVNQPGDTDLNSLLPSGQQTFDACVLQFDFIPVKDKLKFQYVFGSDEYPEFVGSSFNDVFGFFLNGQNIALLPGTTTVVSINNVNDGNGPNNPPQNQQFFVNNYTNGGTKAVTIDGMTVVLTILADVNQGQTNTIKLAIADTSDRILDSAVFLKKGSFTSGEPEIPKAPVMKVFNPMRFTFNRFTGTFDGVLILVNVGNDTQPGPVFVIFKRLPFGAKLMNKLGKTPEGKPFLKIKDATISPNESFKLVLKIRNPFNQPLGTFYQTSNLQFTAESPA